MKRKTEEQTEMTWHGVDVDRLHVKRILCSGVLLFRNRRLVLGRAVR
jgi:hypothetical protein